MQRLSLQCVCELKYTSTKIHKLKILEKPNLFLWW